MILRFATRLEELSLEWSKMAHAYESCLGLQCPNYSDLCCRRNIRDDTVSNLNTKIEIEDEIWENVRRSAEAT